ncbi:MAG: hypothetical protein KAJ14_06850 [Candidatus Omnitrophica bacterium]|nr:hypothetical protein [Candidatus Omnitrophota bacterium]
MLEKFINKIKSLAKTPSTIDPSKFKDPIADRTKWTPAKIGGTTFCTHKIIQTNPYSIEFKSSFGAKIFYLLFTLIGLGLIVGFTFSSFHKGINPESIFPIFIGLIFFLIGGCLFYFGNRPIIFNKMSGHFWKGDQDPKQIIDKSKIKHYCKLSDIHALQIISEYCRGNKSSFYSYELNLVLTSAKRLNIIDHGNLKKLREDAKIISLFLGKPVWDGV